MKRHPEAPSPRFLSHMRWARSIASRWRFIEDVEQAALLGLLLADRTAAPTLTEAEFRRYAAVRVRGEVVDHLRRVAHGGRRQGRTAQRPRKPEPESVAMARDMGLLPQQGTHGEPLAGELDPEAQTLANERQRALRAAVEAADLTPRSRVILERRLRGDRAIDIASDLGVTQARVSQLVADAGEKIRRARDGAS